MKARENAAGKNVSCLVVKTPGEKNGAALRGGAAVFKGAGQGRRHSPASWTAPRSQITMQTIDIAINRQTFGS